MTEKGLELKERWDMLTEKGRGRNRDRWVNREEHKAATTIDSFK